MANRFDWNALEERITAVLDEYPELSRTKALSVVAACELFDIDSEEAVDAITDGANDRGVDLFFIDDRDGRNDIHLMQAKCVETFDRSKRNFPGNEVDKIISFINDLSAQDESSFQNANELIKTRIADAFEILKQAKATITVHFVGNCKGLVQDERDRLENAFSRYRAISFEMHNLDSLSDYFLEKQAPNLSREISAIDNNFFDRTDQNLRGIVCTVLATDIVEMIRSKENPSEVEPSIFDQNVRVYLKRRNRINKIIISSALDEENHMFWYRNNGITMTCDKMEMGPSRRNPKISMQNVQIVNGGQTSNCLFEAWQENSERVADVLLLVRIIETTSEDIKLAIAESTNSQTPINVRDLKANDRLQRQLELTFADMGYFYERKKGQFANEDRAMRIDALDAGQAFLAYGVGLPEVAKKDRGRVFGDLYETVFSDEVSAQKLLVSHQLIAAVNQRKTEVRRKIREEEQLEPGRMALVDGAFHALFAIRQLGIERKIDLWDFEAANQLVDDAISAVETLYKEAVQRDENFSSNRFFKEARTKDLVTRAVA
ncbi:AIPR family protein [Aurantiacibacter aquimixticola]|uniref:Abortive phage infection protein n=1 Tax=Aurantiacibacter aquimixticola TaxID=1958945 RepID=A0A419RT48_9SPHN|nr:AIPR family protein [Aurantiacibacter aquimixticola]RJY08946.1 abortive phage infection protein [Aurantiacibacter aquimixticola]